MRRNLKNKFIYVIYVCRAPPCRARQEQRGKEAGLLCLLTVSLRGEESYTLKITLLETKFLIETWNYFLN